MRVEQGNTKRRTKSKNEMIYNIREGSCCMFSCPCCVTVIVSESTQF